MEQKKKLVEGDVFFVMVGAKYVFARILMDIDTRILKREPDHPMIFFEGCYLIEVYKGIYDKPEMTTNEIVLPSQFTFKKYFYSKNYKIDWSFYVHDIVDFKKIDFPENLEVGVNNIINLRKFDLSLPTKTTFEHFPQGSSGSQKYTSAICSSFYQMVDEALHLQGRDDLMQVKRTHFLDNNDLRMANEDREAFYEQIEEDLSISYYNLALKHGFNLGRFYEQ